MMKVIQIPTELIDYTNRILIDSITNSYPNNYYWDN